MFATLAPLAAGATVAIELSRVLPTSSTLAATVLRVVGVAVVSTAVVFGVDRGARRLLPLAALYRLSLVFPDHAPSRFRTALKAGSSRRVERFLEETRRSGLPNDAAEAARRVVELITAIGDHDRRTRGHSERVRLYADLIGEEMRLSKEERQKLQWAALLHDLGKLKVPPEILNKKGAPTNDEWAVLRGHPAAGEWLVRPLRPFLGMWADAIGGHHEWWNGAGYPRNLKGDEISPSAAIVAVADAYEVMTAVRSYKKSMPASEARAELTRKAGVQFSPDVVRAFLCVSLGKVRLATGPHASLAQIPYLGSAVRFPATVTTAIQGATSVAGAAVPSVAAGVMVATTAVATSIVASPPAPAAHHARTYAVVSARTIDKTASAGGGAGASGGAHAAGVKAAGSAGVSRATTGAGLPDGVAAGGTGGATYAVDNPAAPPGTDATPSSPVSTGADPGADPGSGSNGAGPPSTDPTAVDPVVGPPIAISIGDSSILEGDSGTRTLAFPVTLSRNAPGAVTVKFTVTAGTATGVTKPRTGADFGLKSGTITFAPGASGETAVEKSIGVTVAGDTAVEGDETMNVTLSDPIGATLARSVATGTILNDDGVALGAATPKPVTAGIGDVSIVQAATDTHPLVLAIPVFLSAKSGVSVSVGFTLDDGSATWCAKASGGDFGGTRSGLLVFAPGKVVQRITVRIWPAPGGRPERSFSIALSSSDPGVKLVRPLGTVTIYGS